VFLGGQALTAMIFIMMQSVWLLWDRSCIVLLQCRCRSSPSCASRVLVLGKQRQISTARQLAGRIAEVMDGAIEIHANDTSNYERADIVERLGRIFQIRFEIYQRKFFVKFLNNFLSAARRPSSIYLVGGYFALRGRSTSAPWSAVIARLQGPAVADQGADRLGPAAPGRADQVRPR
jgi:putative ABC transport system ATP-binding protein